VKIVVADDNAVSRRVLQGALSKWGHSPILAESGSEALAQLRRQEQGSLAILDWLMPEMDGLEVCRQVRQDSQLSSSYLILLTAKNHKEDVIKGLESGADDYVVKPFDFDELHARVQVGVRVVQLQSALADRVRQLEQALQRERQLMGLLPICSYCKKIRDDRQEWQPMELYLAHRSEVRFSHSICPECAKKWEQEFNGG
jgi:sigma-B regulation protein RsbU (phosphoserine phosphatase)